jgi:hypothetical protein
MTLYEVRCCRQCDAIKAYGRLLGISDDDAARRWVVYGHAKRWCNAYKDKEQ